MDDQQTDQTQDTANSQEMLEKLQTDLVQAMDGWKRTAADFENYKRRKEAENRELVEFAREVAVAKLLPTLDALGQAMKHIPSFAEASEGKPEHADSELLPSSSLEKEEGTAETPSFQKRGQGEFKSQYSNWQAGIKGILLQLDQTFAELGVKRIEALGKKFDPHFHEAVREVESDREEGIVVEELQHGFELNGKVIRPSQVAISKKKL